MPSQTVGAAVCDGMFRVTWSHGHGEHQFTELEPSAEDWLERLASRYRALRIESTAPLTQVRMNNITIADTSRLERFLASRLVPPAGSDNFNVVRSDFAEVILSVLGEIEHDARYGYQSIRDRELIKLPGRGLDCLGVEGDFDTEGRIAIGEAKTSSSKSIPKVVDAADDSLLNQHLKHISSPSDLIDKLTHSSKFAKETSIRNDLLAAAIAMEEGKSLPLYCCSVLVRPKGRYVNPADFGSLLSDPSVLLPGSVRFYIIVVPDSIQTTIYNFGKFAKGQSLETQKKGGN